MGLEIISIIDHNAAKVYEISENIDVDKYINEIDTNESL